MVGPVVPSRTVMIADSEVTLPRRLLVLAFARSLGVVLLTLLIYSVAPVHSQETAIYVVSFAVLGLLGVVVVFSWQLSRISRSLRPGIAAVEAFILVFGMFLTLFATIYVGLFSNDPAAFSQPVDKVAAFYFSVTVLATVGFGDISPVSDAARISVTIQMILDLVLIGVAVKVLGSSARRAMARQVQASSGAPSSGADQEGGLLE